jgi:hypothetical protein
MKPRTQHVKNSSRVKAVSRRSKNQIGPRIVYAWFSTVVNPLLMELRQEQTFLEKRNWTWVFRTGGMEFVRYIREYLPNPSLDNLEQFLSFHKLLGETLLEHDNWIEKLRVHCTTLQGRLVANPELLRAYRKATSRKALAQLGVTLDHLFGAYPQQDHLYLLAQYIINHTEFLPDYYYTAKLWNQHKDEFLAILAHPSVADAERLTTTTGEYLLSVTSRLVELLKTTREDLSLRYDVPYVTPASLLIQDEY